MPKSRPIFENGTGFPETDEEWNNYAIYLGAESGQVLKEQTKLADEILEEILLEEKQNMENNKIATDFIKSWAENIARRTGIPVHDISIAYEAVEHHHDWVWAVKATYMCKEGRKKPYRFTMRAYNDFSLPEACDELVIRVEVDTTRIKPDANK